MENLQSAWEKAVLDIPDWNRKSICVTKSRGRNSVSGFMYGADMYLRFLSLVEDSRDLGVTQTIQIAISIFPNVMIPVGPFGYIGNIGNLIIRNPNLLNEFNIDVYAGEHMVFSDGFDQFGEMPHVYMDIALKLIEMMKPFCKKIWDDSYVCDFVNDYRTKFGVEFSCAEIAQDKILEISKSFANGPRKWIEAGLQIK